MDSHQSQREHFLTGLYQGLMEHFLTDLCQNQTAHSLTVSCRNRMGCSLTGSRQNQTGCSLTVSCRNRTGCSLMDSGQEKRRRLTDSALMDYSLTACPLTDSGLTGSSPARLPQASCLHRRCHLIL